MHRMWNVTCSKKRSDQIPYWRKSKADQLSQSKVKPVEGSERRERILDRAELCILLSNCFCTTAAVFAPVRLHCELGEKG